MTFDSTSVPTDLWNADINNDERRFYMFILEHSLNFGYANFSNLYASLCHTYSKKKVQRMVAALRSAKLIKTEIIGNSYRRIFPLFFGSYRPRVNIYELTDANGTLIHPTHSPIKEGFSLPDWSQSRKGNNELPSTVWDEIFKDETQVVSNLGGKTESWDKLCPSYNNTSYSYSHKSSSVPSDVDIEIQDSSNSIVHCVDNDPTNNTITQQLLSMLNRLNEKVETLISADIEITESLLEQKEKLDTLSESFILGRLNPPPSEPKKTRSRKSKTTGIIDKATQSSGENNLTDISSLHKKETKADRMKKYNQANHYARYTTKVEGEEDCVTLLRIIHNTYPEIMSITKPLTEEQGEKLFRLFEIDEIKDALAYLNGWAGRNKYDNVFGAIQAVITQKRSWTRKY